MRILRAYKVELDLNNKQRTLFLQHAGAARFAYNWALARRIEEYKLHGRTSSAIDQHKLLVIMKKSPEYSWLCSVSKCAPQEALRDLDKAYQNFFRRAKRGENPGFPKFKSRRNGVGSFRFSSESSFLIYPDRIRLPRIGIVKLKEKNYIPMDNIKIISITCSERANRWFASINCETEIPDSTQGEGDVIGIDLGIKYLAVVSDGRVFPKHGVFKKCLKQLQRLQRELSRRQRGSKNRAKTKAKLANLYYKISSMRKDYLHKATSAIVRAKAKPSVVALEDLNVLGMLKNHKIARAVSDVGMYEYRRQIEYKSLWNGISIFIAPRFFASSKTCSVCGLINKDLKLSERKWVCSCGVNHDRDLNAATNLANLAKITVNSTENYACGQVFNIPDRSRNQILDYFC